MSSWNASAVSKRLAVRDKEASLAPMPSRWQTARASSGTAVVGFLLNEMTGQLACLMLATLLAGSAAAHAPEAMAAIRPADMAADVEAGRLGTAASKYRALAAQGGWQLVPDGPSLHPGETSAAVPAIRSRLAVTGDLLAAGAVGVPAAPELYDDDLVAAVRAFQIRHGLSPDGVVGKRTRTAMNVPLSERIAQLDLNYERVAREAAPARRYVRVNIPEYRLVLVDGDTRVLDMPVVVGRRDRRTPFMESAITWVIFNPAWTVPTKLAYEDLLPKVRRDPAYFTKTGIQIYESWRPGAAPIDSAWIDWTAVGPGMRRLKLRQAPGRDNPLGRIKFHMDNDEDIYLHDTNHRGLMARDGRALSSGCIRVANAEALARELLRDHPSWPPERITKVLSGRQTVRVMLREAVAVRLTYQTAWVDAQETVHFREDIYGVDASQIAEGRVSR
jgi:murein L,D-transpeptidase YcbB/YkuD